MRALSYGSTYTLTLLLSGLHFHLPVLSDGHIPEERQILRDHLVLNISHSLYSERACVHRASLQQLRPRSGLS